MIFQRYICYVKKIIIDQNVFITGLCHLGLKHWAFPNSLYDLFLTDLGKTNSTGSAWKILVDSGHARYVVDYWAEAVHRSVLIR